MGAALRRSRRTDAAISVNDPGPLMAHITGLVTRAGIGLINCERCRETIDASDACVGTLVTESLDRSVLLCSGCAQDPEAQSWLEDYLAGPDAPEPGCEVA